MNEVNPLERSDLRQEFFLLLRGWQRAMRKSKVLNYKTYAVNCSVFGQDGRYSAVAKIGLSIKNKGPRKFIALNNNCSSEESAEAQIIQEAYRVIENFSE